MRIKNALWSSRGWGGRDEEESDVPTNKDRFENAVKKATTTKDTTQPRHKTQQNATITHHTSHNSHPQPRRKKRMDGRTGGKGEKERTSSGTLIRFHDVNQDYIAIRAPNSKCTQSRSRLPFRAVLISNQQEDDNDKKITKQSQTKPSLLFFRRLLYYPSLDIL